MRRFYLAEYTDTNPHSRTYGQAVIRRVTADGMVIDTSFSRGRTWVPAWRLIYAESAAEARARFARGEGTRFS